MAAIILSDDFLIICLILAEGEVDTSMLDIVLRVEEYQESANRHFGITRSDFRNGIYRLLYECGEDLDSVDDRLASYTLRRLIYPILKYDDFYCNDEGEHWCDFREIKSSEAHRRMLEFFKDTENYCSGRVMLLLEGLDKNMSQLFDCSRLGESS